MTNQKPITMKALRLQTYGKPFDVLRLEDVAIPSPGAGQVRVRVHACALNTRIGPCAKASCPFLLQ